MPIPGRRDPGIHFLNFSGKTGKAINIRPFHPVTSWLLSFYEVRKLSHILVRAAVAQLRGFNMLKPRNDIAGELAGQDSHPGVLKLFPGLCL